MGPANLEVSTPKLFDEIVAGLSGRLSWHFRRLRNHQKKRAILAPFQVFLVPSPSPARRPHHCLPVVSWCCLLVNLSDSNPHPVSLSLPIRRRFTTVRETANSNGNSLPPKP